MEQGAVSGNPIVDVKVRLVDGSTMRSTARTSRSRSPGDGDARGGAEGHPLLLEPVMDVHVVVPSASWGT